MIGIYKITNTVNSHCYIGQSRYIETRWKNHKIAATNPNDRGYEYPLYRAIRKYGIENFTFEILEECSLEKLNEQETYWIQYYKADYNQTIGGDYNIIPQKLTFEQVQEIQQILIKDAEGLASHKDLAERYGVHKDTIRDINVGRSWYDPSLNYPLHYSKYDNRNPNKQTQKYCIDCGKKISIKATRCLDCENIQRKQIKPVTREQLKDLIRQHSFTAIGKMYNVSDNTIRKWCKSFNLPYLAKEIKQFTPEQWANI